MFSKALFKQSMKAHWVKWVTVTTATCAMLAIVIIVLGNLGINNIRDSLKGVFIQANAESELKEQAVDGYELYLTTVGLFQTLDSPQGDEIVNFVVGLVNEYDSTLASENATTPIKIDIVRNKLASKYAGLVGTNYPNVGPDVIKIALMQLYTNYDELKALGVVDSKVLIENAYNDAIYDISYYDFTIKGETPEFCEMAALGAQNAVKEAKKQYDSLGVSSEYPDLATQYMNEYLYNQMYNVAIGEGQSVEDATMYAVTIKIISNTAISTYQLWLNEGADITKDEAREQACKSISDQIPEKVSIALTELGEMDMYGLIIGSIFYRIAGLLLPMVFVIMTANGLLAGQVDSGSMAYVLSTPTKRRTVATTQLLYLLAALFSMFGLLTIVSVIAVFVSGGNNFAIDYGEILMFNLGAFLTMFAFAGFCYMCSSIFNRTKYSLGIGGGVTIFSLVCTILGLFGSSVVPSAMRIEPMNFFNYLSIITLFDTTEILSGSLDFLWKFAILAGIGIITFIIGVFRFDKKDLPL